MNDQKESTANKKRLTEEGTITLREVWDAIGGNPNKENISKQEIIEILKGMDRMINALYDRDKENT